MARFAKVEVFQAVRARLGEGPCWHEARQTLWWIDILGQKLFERDLTNAEPRVIDLPQMVGAVVETKSGGLIAALREGIFLIDPQSGVVSPYASAPDHDPQHFRFNDGKVDPQGRFWAGTLALDDRSGQSHLYRIGNDRTVARVRDGISVSNGIAWAPDGRTMYYIDSPTRRVQAFDFEGESGSLRSPRVAIQLSESDGYPDGCCMDVDGCLWVAHWGGAKVTRWDPVAGKLLSTISLPVANVTSCAFGGPRRDQLFVTTAVDEGKEKSEPEAGYVFRIDVGTTGPKLASFTGA
ncbi:MAG: SMP-30/gluconolactonase/LRE family protein [Opitutus sp.]